MISFIPGNQETNEQREKKETPRNKLFFFNFYLFMIVTHTERERGRDTGRGRSRPMHREPDVGFDPGSPGSCPGPKAVAKPLRHPGIPLFLPVPGLVASGFPGMRSFLLDCLIYWRNAAHNKFLRSFVFPWYWW